MLKNKNSSNSATFVLLLAVSSFFFANVVLPSAMGDRGGFSPIGVRVSETAQKATIAWNGTREVLILSTDVNSGNESEVVEIMPLPSNPTISKGETASFTKVTSLINLYFDLTVNRRRFYYRYGILQSMEGGGGYSETVTITFQEAIGPHFLTVVKAEDTEDLMRWMKEFLETRGYYSALPAGLKELLGKYIQDETRFFCIDMIRTNSTVKTVDPLVYEFNSSKMYYPLRISSLFSGDTSISLFTITTNPLKRDPVLGGTFAKRAQFQITKEASAKVSVNTTRLFPADPYLCYFTFYGLQKDFDSDILGEFQSGSDQSDSSASLIAMVALNAGWGLMLLFLFPPLKIGFFSKTLHISLTKRLQVTSLLTGLVGVVLASVGSIVPWGLAGFGEGGELLLPLNGSSETAQLNGPINILFILVVFAVIPCYVYLLLIKGNSGIASLALAITGVSVLVLALAPWAILHSADIGAFSTLTGSMFTALAGLLSVMRMQLGPEVGHPMTKFRTYVTRRFLIFILTVMAVLIPLFWLNTLLPYGYRYPYF